MSGVFFPMTILLPSSTYMCIKAVSSFACSSAELYYRAITQPYYLQSVTQTQCHEALGSFCPARLAIWQSSAKRRSRSLFRKRCRRQERTRLSSRERVWLLHACPTTKYRGFFFFLTDSCFQLARAISARQLGRAQQNTDRAAVCGSAARARRASGSRPGGRFPTCRCVAAQRIGV